MYETLQQLFNFQNPEAAKQTVATSVMAAAFIGIGSIVLRLLIWRYNVMQGRKILCDGCGYTKYEWNGEYELIGRKNNDGIIVSGEEGKFYCYGCLFKHKWYTHIVIWPIAKAFFKSRLNSKFTKEELFIIKRKIRIDKYMSIRNKHGNPNSTIST